MNYLMAPMGTIGGKSLLPVTFQVFSSVLSLPMHDYITGTPGGGGVT